MSGSAPRRSAIPTTLLLTCAALGVAGGVLLAPANWLSTVLLSVGNPTLSMATTGLWTLPPVIALRLLRTPMVGILVGIIAGLVIVPFSGYGFVSVITNASLALPAELPFMLVLWRYWKTWMHYAGAAMLGVAFPLFWWEFFHMGSQPLWSQILFFAVTFASCIGSTALGILIADKLRAAGVGRR